jgi:hypothetical protein
MSVHHLYSITSGQLVVEHTLLAQCPPILHTWHGRLSHANYRAVYDLARSGHTTGMPIDLSIAPGSCADCIVGKQKRSSVPQTRWGTRALGGWVSYM